MAVKNRVFLVSGDQSDVSIFWNDGVAPFSLESPGAVRVALSAPEKEWLYGHAVYEHAIALNRQACSKQMVKYSLRDSAGKKIDFMVTCFEPNAKSSIDDITLNLDAVEAKDGTEVSQRLLLWNRLKELPASSSKRMSLQWLLFTGTDPD